ncbi:MAG: energy transducer TonB [Bacteroidota bacterium]|jgi:protein TonB
MAHPISFKAGGFHLPSFSHRNSNAIIPVSAFSVEGEHRDLRKAVYRNLEKALAISALIHFILVGTYYAVEYLNSGEDEAPVVKVRIMKYSDLGPPPSITNSLSAPVVGVAKMSRPSFGTPIPVPDAEINPEQTIATQTEMSSVSSPIIESDATGGSGGSIQISDDTKIDDEPGMNDFIPVEKSPQIVRSVKPEFPEIARRAGIEGTVWVNILIDKKGKPQKAVIVKEESGGLFNDVAVAAAMKYQFTPAYMNTGPVKVWVAIKFSFKLTDPNK